MFVQALGDYYIISYENMHEFAYVLPYSCVGPKGNIKPKIKNRFS